MQIQVHLFVCNCNLDWPDKRSVMWHAMVTIVQGRGRGGAKKDGGEGGGDSR